tara:strand:- start:150 stop:773 length:624 start_codon:yes stop_codon:yes gene_type:complete
MIIHFLAPEDRTKWPKLWHHCLKSWQKYNCNYKIWNDNDIDTYLKCYDSEFYKVISGLHKIFKLDYVRYVILENIGGVYADMDMELTAPFIHLLDKQKIYIVEANASDEYVQNSLMISPPSNFWSEFLLQCRKNIIENIEVVSKYPQITEHIPGHIVRKTVGPIALSEFVKQNNQYSFDILPATLFNNSNDISFTKHHQTGIWGFFD